MRCFSSAGRSLSDSLLTRETVLWKDTDLRSFFFGLSARMPRRSPQLAAAGADAARASARGGGVAALLASEPSSRAQAPTSSRTESGLRSRGR